MDSTAQIPGGFAKSWRKEMKSEIWLMPPLYHRVWYWLRMNVQYEPFLFPSRSKFGIWVLPGQRVTSLQQIAEGVKWVEWGRELIPNKKSIKDVIEWLENHEMVTVVSNAKGTLITLVNWHAYNRHADEEVTGKSIAEVTRSGHKEERKEREEGKKQKASSSSDDEAPAGDGVFFLTKKKRKLSGKRLETFNLFWDAFGYKIGKAEAADSWLDIPSMTESLVTKIVEGAKREAARRPSLLAERKTPKMAQGWLSARRWEDEPLLARATVNQQPASPISAKAAELNEKRKRVLAHYDN